MPGSKLVRMMQEQIRAQLPRGIELGTVTAPLPQLRIKLDHMPVELEADDLIICEHLLEYQIVYDTAPEVDDSEMTPAGMGPHVHDITALTLAGQRAKIYPRIDVGSRVAIMALPGGQKYLVWDRVVDMSG